MSVCSANLASGGGKVAIPILVRATIRGAVGVVAVRIVLLSIPLIVFSSIIKNLHNDHWDIVVIGEGEGIICRNADLMITILSIMFNNVGVRIELIPIKDFFGDGMEGIRIWLHFFLLDIIIIIVFSIILIIEIGPREAVTEAFITDYALL